MILKIAKTNNYEAKDGLYIWNGKGWDIKATQSEMLQPRLLIKNGEILWLELPKSESDEITKLKTQIKGEISNGK